MSDPYILPFSDRRATLESVGGKGASLARLAQAGLPVPTGFHITTTAYRQFVSDNNLGPTITQALNGLDFSNPQALETASQAITEKFLSAPIPGEVANEIVQSYAPLPGISPPVAVRSSATTEDLPEASFAGQQETFLNVSGAEAVLDATKKCWASLWTARAIGYRARQGFASSGVALAVVVQQLVPSEAAGIMFTANPMNWRRDLLVISAAWGLGEAVVGGLVTPDNLTLDKTSGKIIERETAEKQVQTVRVNGGTAEQPVPENLQREPVLSDSQAGELARLGREIEGLYQAPMDIEWALADGKFAIVQARPITTLPEPETPVPTEWSMPDPKGRYMRTSIVDLMPDPLSPLFATLGLESINRGISRMAQEQFNLPPGTFGNVMTTINGYAYQEVNFSPKVWLNMIFRMVPRLPRMLREGVKHWKEVAHPRYAETVADWHSQEPDELSPQDLWEAAKSLVEAFSDHLGALMASTMGPTSGSEGLFTRVYEKMVMQPDDPPAPTFLMGFENVSLRAEKALYELALWCRENNELANFLQTANATELSQRLYDSQGPEGVDPNLWAEWLGRFRGYLREYGYSIYDMDFAKPLPMDEPAPLLEMLKLFLRGQGKNPYERQKAYTQKREQAEQVVRSRVKGFRRWAFEKALGWAQSQAPLREDGIAEIGLAYPILRQVMVELGRHFVKAGVLSKAGDIYWLERDEIETLITMLNKEEKPPDKRETVGKRRALWKARQRAIPPPQLPPGERYMGFDLEGVLTAGAENEHGDTIKGVAASPGRVTAPARVLHGPEDFPLMQPGEILVAGITTPAWTPLFSLAAGVVTDIGGPLSHGSIVAREYGIPAVLGTGTATRRIQSGQLITVDGAAGTVKTHNGAQ